ncbi:hypothetical protein [Halopseudomonas maritima]|nr:hypothetical protein [Halopseudomonas maritima]
MGKLVKGAAPDDADKQAIIERTRTYAMPAMMKLQRFLTAIN